MIGCIGICICSLVCGTLYSSRHDVENVENLLSSLSDSQLSNDGEKKEERGSFSLLSVFLAGALSPSLRTLSQKK